MGPDWHQIGLDRHLIDIVLAIGWNSIGIGLALGWHLIYIELALDRHMLGIRFAQDWLDWHQIGFELTPLMDWQPLSLGLAQERQWIGPAWQ